MVLALRFEYSNEEIENSRLLSAVEVAEQQRDKLIEKSLELLKPLGVEYLDLKAAVDLSLKRKGKL